MLAATTSNHGKHNLSMLTHEERKNRRAEIALACRRMFEDGKKTCDVYSTVSQRFGVGTGTVINACKEFGVKADKSTQRVIAETSKLYQLPESIHPNTQKILDLLKDPTKSQVDIAAKVGCTRQLVSAIHKKFFLAGLDLPSKAEILDQRLIDRERKMLEQDQRFIKRYLECEDLEFAAHETGISIDRAKKALRRHGYTLGRRRYGEAAKLAEAQGFKKQPITGYWLYIVADLLEAKLTGSEIAKKWGVPTPRIFNLIAECKAAGIEIVLRDGRYKENKENKENKESNKN